MLGALFAVGTEGSISSVMGNTNTAGLERAPKLPDMSNQAEQSKPVSFPTNVG
jgi:hypothetical protein